MVPKLFTRSAFVIPAQRQNNLNMHSSCYQTQQAKSEGRAKLTDARVGDGQCVVGLVGCDVNVELWVALQDALVREALEANLVQRI